MTGRLDCQEYYSADDRPPPPRRDEDSPHPTPLSKMAVARSRPARRGPEGGGEAGPRAAGVFDVAGGISFLGESADSLRERLDERARAWGVAVEETLETQSSVVAFGRRGRRPVVLKVVRGPGDEWRGGEVLGAFAGRGTARVYEHVGGAVLMERLSPGTALAAVALGGRDEEATEVLVDVIRRMSHPLDSPRAFPTVEDWGGSFECYLASGDGQVPRDLVEQGRQLYQSLCASQRGVRLLHGDLQHYNVLLDSRRGWLAVDPKGVVGEVEYEVGAALRNPYERPELFASPGAVEKRVTRYADRLGLDAGRTLAWGFAQAVLSAIWSVEDGFAVDAGNPSLARARAVRPLVEGPRPGG